MLPVNLQKQKPWRCRAYLDWVKGLPCALCNATGVDPHHIIGVGHGVMGSKAADWAVMPLCRQCHDWMHRDSYQWGKQRDMALRTIEKAVAEGKLTLTWTG